MRPFELVRTATLRDAARQALKGGVLKAGGIDLLDRLKERIESPEKLVDILTHRGEIGAIRTAGGRVHIGALATIEAIATSGELRGEAFAALRAAARATATPQIRHRATLGGNLLQINRCWYFRSAGFTCAHDGKGPTCLAIPGENRYHAVLGASDCPRVHPSNLAPALLVLDAEAVVEGAEGERRMPLAALYPAAPRAAAPEHTLAAGEVLREIILPEVATGTRSAYAESREKQSHDWATTAAAVRLRLRDGRIHDARVCLGAVAPVPFLVAEATALLEDQKPAEELFGKIATLAYASARPLAHNAYKLTVGRAVLLEALRRAANLPSPR